MKRARSLMGPEYAEPVWLWTDSVDATSNGTSATPDTEEEDFRPVNLEDKVALIVGGASEPGDELTLSFAERGMDVAIIFFEERHERARSIKEAVEEMGRRCLVIHGGGAEAQDEARFARRAVEKILATLGRLDVYVNVSERAFPLGSEALATAEPEALGPALLPRFPIMKEALDHIVG